MQGCIDASYHRVGIAKWSIQHQQQHLVTASLTRRVTCQGLQGLLRVTVAAVAQLELDVPPPHPLDQTVLLR